VFDRTVESPLYFAKSHGVEAPATPPILDIVLEEGDVLYVPKGFWHYAVSTEEPSLHLTLAMFVRTGIDFLNWLVGELREDVRFRREFPLIGPQTLREHAGHPYDARVGSIMDDLMSLAADPSMGARFEAYMAAHLTHRRRFRFPADFMPEEKVACCSVFERPGIKPLVRTTNQVEICFHGKTIALEARFAPLVETLFASARGRLKVSEIAVPTGCTREEVAEVMSEFGKQGLLEPVG
jgi:hypothetical protein